MQLEKGRGIELKRVHKLINRLINRLQQTNLEGPLMIYSGDLWGRKLIAQGFPE